jgi:hypothetical protein
MDPHLQANNHTEKTGYGHSHVHTTAEERERKSEYVLDGQEASASVYFRASVAHDVNEENNERKECII